MDMASRRNIPYSKLATDEDDDIYDGSRSGCYDPRFEFTPKALDKIPRKSIALALFLLSLVSLLLFLSLFIFTGHIGGEKSQAIGLLVLGILTFLPGTHKATTTPALCLDMIPAIAGRTQFTYRSQIVEVTGKWHI